jgi:hypothetical protein
MRFSRILSLTILGSIGLASACERNTIQPPAETPSLLRDTASVRLNYRYEPDVPAPTIETAPRSDTDRNAGVQADFDAGRNQELLDRTITSPDKRHVLAVYRSVNDLPSEVRLDMYSSEGKLLHKITPDAMAGRFPDTIVWSPDSRTVAFVAVSRTVGLTPAATPTPNLPTTGDANDPNADPVPTPTPVATAPTPLAPTGILTFRTEQLYICEAEGTGIKALTQNEGLIYFYYAWSPDSSMLAALATTSREWRYQEIISDGKQELMVPQGRLRIIEKNSRERKLDDNQTAVRPIWSPDSAKLAVAYETQVRVYDAAGQNPTQAAIPLKNPLLISSQAYDRDQQRKLASNADSNAANTPSVPDQPLTTLPDEKLLVSYNPIVEIAWSADNIIYLKTAYVRRMKNDADSVTSFSRWHRLILTPQAAVPAK